LETKRKSVRSTNAWSLSPLFRSGIVGNKAGFKIALSKLLSLTSLQKRNSWKPQICSLPWLKQANPAKASVTM
jgi:hypothetical protein